jgi:hypothetical protein
VSNGKRKRWVRKKGEGGGEKMREGKDDDCKGVSKRCSLYTFTSAR